jgi:hypothetical protein
VHWEFLLLDDVSADFFITPIVAVDREYPSPAYYSGADIVTLGVSSGNFDIPVARLNGPGPVAAKSSVFGSVKALYR